MIARSAHTQSMKHPILAINLGVVGIFVAVLGLLSPDCSHAAVGPRPMSIHGNLTGADGVVWGRVTEGFQMAVALNETRLRVGAWVRNPTSETQPFNATLLGYGGAVDLQVLTADGEWHRVEEKYPPGFLRSGIGAITDWENHWLQPGEIMAKHYPVQYAKKSAYYADSAASHRATNVTASTISLPTLPFPSYNSLLASMGITSLPVMPSTKAFRDGAVNRQVRDGQTWLATATLTCSLIWREWPEWIFDKPRVTIRITQRLSDSSPSNRTFTIESPAIELESDLIRRAIAERNDIASSGAPVPASAIALPPDRKSSQ